MEPTLGDLELLYRNRYGEFLRVATALTGDQALAADAVQDAFARAIVHRSDFRGDGPVEAWVWRIVINAAHTSRPRYLTAELATAPEAMVAEQDLSSLLSRRPAD